MCWQSKEYLLPSKHSNLLDSLPTFSGILTLLGVQYKPPKPDSVLSLTIVPYVSPKPVTSFHIQLTNVVWQIGQLRRILLWIKKCKKLGRGDYSLGKVFSHKSMRTCIQIPKTCTEVRIGDISVTQLGMGTARQVPEAHGPSNLAKMQSSGFSKRTCVVPKEQVWGLSYLSFSLWLFLCLLCFVVVGTRDRTQESHMY